MAYTCTDASASLYTFTSYPALTYSLLASSSSSSFSASFYLLLIIHVTKFTRFMTPNEELIDALAKVGTLMKSYNAALPAISMDERKTSIEATRNNEAATNMGPTSGVFRFAFIAAVPVVPKSILAPDFVKGHTDRCHGNDLQVQSRAQCFCGASYNCGLV